MIFIYNDKSYNGFGDQGVEVEAIPPLSRSRPANTTGDGVKNGTVPISPTRERASK